MSLLSICYPTQPATVGTEASVAEAIRLMLELHVGAVAVVDSEERVAGIFTERDVLMKAALSGWAPERTPMREVMTTPVVMATELTSEAEALKVMLDRHYRHLPIVDDNGRLLGMLSIRNLLQARVEGLMKELDSVRPRPD